MIFHGQVGLAVRASRFNIDELVSIGELGFMVDRWWILYIMTCDIYHYHESQPLGSARVGEVFFAEQSELRGSGGRAGKTGRNRGIRCSGARLFGTFLRGMYQVAIGYGPLVG